MIEDLKYHSFIGISGSARSGKDTLCRALIRKFKKMNKKVERLSIAGDLIKKDLNSLIKNVAGIDTFTENTEEKELIRPC
jgi:molybdopterin-guanine dinucleotide biosynthesis protein